MDSVTETLKSGDSVNFTGFGKFSPSDRAARQGVNPRTGERVPIAVASVPTLSWRARMAATPVPKFSAGSHLKAALKSELVPRTQVLGGRCKPPSVVLVTFQ